MNINELYLLSDAARLLGCKPHRITYLLTSQQVPEPKRIGGRRMFGRNDLQRLAKHLNANLELPHERRNNV